MKEDKDKENSSPIMKFVGEPNEPNVPFELTRWQKFLRFLLPWAKKGGKLIGRTKELTEAYYTAEVAKKQGEAEKFAAEAAEISAETELKKQETVKVVNDEIGRIFSQENDIPDIAKHLQLANLIANNPQIAEQLNKIKGMVQNLKDEHDTTFELKIEEKKPEKLLSSDEQKPRSQ